MTGKTDLPPIVVPCRGRGVDDLLSREWLLTNDIGAYASSTVIGCNTRRYHGLLVAATMPPARRVVALSNILDQLVLPDEGGGETVFDLATFEFDGAISPDGHGNLVEFRGGPAGTFVYRCGPVDLVKEIILAESANAVAVRYSLAGGAGGAGGPGGTLRLRPFVALRDYHGLRNAHEPNRMRCLRRGSCVIIEDVDAAIAPLRISAGRGGRFHPQQQWWYRFVHRADVARGQEGFEDLYSPGWFQADLSQEKPVQLTASLGEPVRINFDAAVRKKRRRLGRIVNSLGAGADRSTARLAAASDAFVAVRDHPDGQPGRTILAGYHWFADWGRDAMIALPGLLLETGQHESARRVLRTFAGAIDEGMIPNCFDERGRGAHYNSMDASLWFILAADRYVRASGDQDAWPDELWPAVEKIIQAYSHGTRSGIGADADGLLAGGDRHTQLTWMDAKFAGEAITPRSGKCVEINALWHCVLRIAARRCGRLPTALEYTRLAERVRSAFEETFWNDDAGCLYDCVGADGKDASIRPNQIIAVSVPHSPLSRQRQRSVVEVVRRELLTPFGLRTLSPQDPKYQGRYAGDWESRDRAYHQGTVWPWLLGPFIEAYLKVNDFSQPAREQARRWLGPLDEHLAEAGVGFISEIFDGDSPHLPRGCIAQAWSVAEILRARRLTKGLPRTI